MSKLTQEFLKSKTWIIDGANGSEIIKQTDKPTGDFGAMTTLLCPEAVQKVHESYLKAGANFIIANTYSVNFNVLGAIQTSYWYQPNDFLCWHYFSLV